MLWFWCSRSQSAFKKLSANLMKQIFFFLNEDFTATLEGGYHARLTPDDPAAGFRPYLWLTRAKILAILYEKGRFVGGVFYETSYFIFLLAIVSRHRCPLP